MFSLSRLALLVVLVTLMVTWVSREVSAAPYQGTMDERAREDIIAMAARIIKMAMNGQPLDASTAKRNAGTLDTLYNIPDLSAIGRR